MTSTPPSGLSLGRCLSNLKSVALTVLEQLLTGQLRTDTLTHIERHKSNAIHSAHLVDILESPYSYQPSTKKSKNKCSRHLNKFILRHFFCKKGVSQTNQINISSYLQHLLMLVYGTTTISLFPQQQNKLFTTAEFSHPARPCLYPLPWSFTVTSHIKIALLSGEWLY